MVRGVGMQADPAVIGLIVADHEIFGRGWLPTNGAQRIVKPEGREAAIDGDGFD